MRIQRSLIAVLLCAASIVSQAADSTPSTTTLLGIRGGEFTLNGQPRFLLGFSYYGALGAQQDAVRKDLDDAQHLGLNWLRVWATWNAFGEDVSAVGTNGAAREPFLAKLKWLVAECDRRGLVVDVTLTRGETLRGFAAHQRAVETLVDALEPHGNWFLDLANEHDVRDGRFVSDAELTRLRDQVRRRDPSRLVTASFGGHDLAPEEIREALLNVGLDFLAPHRPRTAQSPRETEAQTQRLRAVMRKLRRTAPILYQEPFRRGYTRWEPRTEDFLNDLHGALAGGAAGWCFHNGQQADAADKQPRRSFDLRKRRLFDQLDAVEQCVAQQAATELVATFETDPTRLVGCGFDRNGDLLNPIEVARALKAAHLNATSVGFFGHDSADPHDLKAVRRWLTPWLAAMRAEGMLTLVTITGTGGPDGWLSRSEFSDEWFTSCIDLLVSLGTKGVMVCPVAEGCIKEAADEPTRSKILRWYRITAERWPGLKGWNFQPRPSPGDVPPGWIGIVHPQSRGDGYPGCLILTDAPLFPRYKTGRYPNEVIIPSELTAFVRQVRAAGKGYIEWGTWEHAEIDTAAIKAVGAAVATAPEPALAPTDTHVWARWETALHSSKAYENPYRDVTLRVTYTGPTGQVQRAYGFWDGGDTFRIRCAFPTPGLWHWRTECSDPANAGLHAQTGTVRVTPYRGGNPLYRHGFLRVSEDRHYLCHADGTPFLWMGDTAWAAPMHATQTDWETYLQDRVAKHFTVVQVAVAPWWAGAKDRQGQPAFLGEHLERWNPAFWKEYERKINAANDQGIFVLVVGIMEPTTRYPEAPEAIRFAQQIAARFYSHFVAFSPSFDSGYRELGDAVGAALREATSVHLITQHPGTPSGQPVNTIAETYFDRPYLDFAGDQSGHNGGNLERCSRQAIEWNLHLFERRPLKPVINLEAMYDTDSPGTIRPNAWRSEDARRLAYQSWLSGAMGYTYGSDLYEWVNDVSKPGYWANIIKLPSSTEMKHLHDLLAQFRWWQLHPDHSRVLDLPKSFVKRPVFARTVSFDTALGYLPTQDPIALNLEGFPEKLRARWYNPRTGEYAGHSEERAPSSRVHFTPPGAGDWVLVLESKAKEPAGQAP